MKKVLFLLSALPLLLCQCGTGGGPSQIGGGKPQGELAFLPEKAERGFLFNTYRPKGHASRKNNWTSQFDLTGVSWNDMRAATLISPRHVVMAAHFTRPPEVPVTFHDGNGDPHERKIVAVRNLPGADVAVAKLDSPLPSAIKPYKLASASDGTPGRLVITTDQSGALSVHRIGAVQGAMVALDYFPQLDPAYRRYMIIGDSGHPSFVVKRGELFLLETHTTGGPGAGPFYGDPGIQAGIRAAIADMDR